MNWQKYIHAHPDILVGKPVLRGTRLSVDFILDLLAAGWKIEQLLESYPQLTPESIQAIFAFAAENLRDEAFLLLPPTP